jgi:hypothetical protein
MTVGFRNEIDGLRDRDKERSLTASSLVGPPSGSRRISYTEIGFALSDTAFSKKSMPSSAGVLGVVGSLPWPLVRTLVRALVGMLSVFLTTLDALDATDATVAAAPCSMMRSRSGGRSGGRRDYRTRDEKWESAAVAGMRWASKRDRV